MEKLHEVNALCVAYPVQKQTLQRNHAADVAMNPAPWPAASDSRGEHSKSWGAGEVRLGSRLTGKVGLVAKLMWRVKLVAELRPGVLRETEVARIERDEQAGLADLGLRLAETKRLTAALQAEIVPAQMAAVGEQRRCCSSCGRRLASKGHYPVTFRSLFGDVPVRVRRLLVCPCQEAAEVMSFGVLDLGRDAVAPELPMSRPDMRRWRRAARLRSCCPVAADQWGAKRGHSSQQDAARG